MAGIKLCTLAQQLKSKASSSWQWSDRLKFGLIIYLDCKLFLYMILQGFNEVLESRYQQAIHSKRRPVLDGNEAISELLEELRIHRARMQHWGLVFRDLGPTALLGFGIFLTEHMIFYHGNFLVKNRLIEATQEDDFILIIQNRRLADQKLARAFDGYLKNMMMLNAKKLSTIMNNSRLKLLSGKETHRLVGDLFHQQAQLRKLLHDKSSLWPDNRQIGWQLDRRKFMICSYYICFIALHFISSTITFSAFYYAHMVLDEKGELPMNLSEGLCLLDYLLAAYLGLDIFAPKVSVLFTNFRDKSRQLERIRERFERLNAMLHLLRYKTSTTTIMITASDHNQSSGDLLASAPALRAQCDQEALEIYLCLRVFIDRLRTAIGSASALASQCSIQSVALLLITLCFLNDTSSYEFSFMMTIIISFTLAMNMVLIVCARFESTCTKTIRKSWSLVAALTDEGNASADDDQEKEGGVRGQISAIVRTKSMSQPSIASAIVKRLGSFRLTQMRGSLINSATASLWRRFVEDLPALNRNFSCTIGGVILLNYRELLSLNFWFLSVVLIVLTHRRQ